MKLWQDVLVKVRDATPAEAETEQAGLGRAETGRPGSGQEVMQVRSVTTVAELKALADPLRMAILQALTSRAPDEMRVLSVKELAAELGEPKTKLYRHIKQLEVAGLIRVASTRLVSGIQEQRYQARQADLTIGPGLLRDPDTADEAAAMVAVFLDDYRRRYVARLAERSTWGEDAAEDRYRRPMLALTTARVSPAKAQSVRDRLREIMAELDEPDDSGGEAIPVEVLVGFMSPG